MLCNYQKVLFNASAVSADTSVNVQLTPGQEVDEGDEPAAYWLHMAGEITAPGTLDVRLRNRPNADSFNVLVRDLGAIIQSMTQVTTAGAGNGVDEMKYLPVVSSRMKLDIDVTGAVAAKVCVVLMSNRPINATVS